jgi:CheY-like chemotaxis protein/LmbE family N-acetylglucosaminyl deacetylase
MTSAEHDGRPGRILLVEDDAVAAHFAMHVLGRQGGFEVVHTPDPAVALQRVSSEAWDLVLTDAELPGMTGLELLEAVCRLSPGLPIAVITAHEPGETTVQALRKRADEFLQKPVRPDRLLAAAVSLVAKGRAARLAARQAVLAIGTHPGDVETGTAGTLLAHRGIGHKVSILTLTRGHGTTSGASGGSGQGGRAGGSEMAALALGATVFLEDLQDTSFEDGGTAASVIRRVIETVRPTAIYTHSLHDARLDHRSTHRAAMLAAREIGSVYCFQSPSATAEFRPTRFVTIDEQVERKLLAVKAFASRGQARDCLEQDLVESTARQWSRPGGGRYAEAFEVIRENAAAAGQPAGYGRSLTA